MLSPPAVSLPTQASPEIPQLASQLPTWSSTKINDDLTDPDQDRDQGVRSRGENGSAGDVHVCDGDLKEVHRHEAPVERPVRQRKPDMKYSAEEYDLSSIQSRSRRPL